MITIMKFILRIFTKQGVWGDLGLLPPGEQELPTQVCHTGFLNINRDDDGDDDDDNDDDDDTLLWQVSIAKEYSNVLFNTS